jgi:hypothetical protein
MSSVQKDIPEEVDILSFLRPIGSLVKKVFVFWGNQFTKIYNNAFLFSIITLAVFAIGFSLRYILPKQYQTKALFITHELPAEVCAIELGNLNQLLKDKSNSALVADRLQISLDAAKALRSVTAKVNEDIFVTNKKEEVDTTNRIFQVTIRLKNPQFTDTVQNSLVRFLENNPYSVRRKEIKRAALHQLKANLLKKVQSFDSLKSIVNSSIIPRSSGQGIILGEPVNPVSIYQAEISYYKEQLKVDEELTLIENIEIIQPFLKLNAPNYPDYNAIALYCLLGGIILAFIIISTKGRK